MEEDTQSSRSEDTPPLKISYVMQKPEIARSLAQYTNNNRLTKDKVVAELDVIQDSEYNIDQITEFLQKYGLVRQVGTRTRRGEEVGLYSSTAKGARVFQLLVHYQEVKTSLEKQITGLITDDMGNMDNRRFE